MPGGRTAASAAGMEEGENRLIFSDENGRSLLGGIGAGLLTGSTTPQAPCQPKLTDDSLHNEGAETNRAHRDA